MRHMATIRRISDIRPIENADFIECAIVDGWSVVVKKGEFRVNDLAIYCEIDSWIPSDIAPFLTKPNSKPREYKGIPGERLRTSKLRGQLSQGLLLPLKDFLFNDFEEGQDVSDIIGIIKWERPVPAILRGSVNGNFPSEIPKTDQERCQNLVDLIKEWHFGGVEWEVTEKLDGSSCTFYLDVDGNFHVCSRNWSIRDDGKNTFWKVCKTLDIYNKMKDNSLSGYAIQGELIGEGIQKNRYNIFGHEFHCYDIYSPGVGFISPPERVKICNILEINHVPVLYEKKTNPENIQEMLIMAEGKSVLNPKTEREGLVWKRLDGQDSFKAISNKFLLKGGD